MVGEHDAKPFGTMHEPSCENARPDQIPRRFLDRNARSSVAAAIRCFSPPNKPRVGRDFDKDPRWFGIDYLDGSDLHRGR